MTTSFAKHPISTKLYEDAMKRTRITNEFNPKVSFKEVCFVFKGNMLMLMLMLMF